MGGYNEWVPIVLALFAAAANALATILQRIGLEEATAGSPARGLMASVLRRPVWFAGLAIATASFLLQALALSLGDLSTVQPVMVTELLFLVLILGSRFHHSLGRREWLTVSGTVVGLGAFLALSSARAGTSRPKLEDWLILLGTGAAAVLVASLLARRGSRSWRAACLGTACGVIFALTAAFLKTTADQWSRGPLFVLSHWEAYGIVVAGIAGLVISQHALDAGPVAASQAALLIVNPLASIVMGVFLFGDHLQRSGGRLGLEVAFLVIMFTSLFGLSHSPLISASGEGIEESLIEQRATALHSGSYPG